MRVIKKNSKRKNSKVLSSIFGACVLSILLWGCAHKTSSIDEQAQNQSITDESITADESATLATSDTQESTALDQQDGEQETESMQVDESVVVQNTEPPSTSQGNGETTAEPTNVVSLEPVASDTTTNVASTKESDVSDESEASETDTTGSSKHAEELAKSEFPTISDTAFSKDGQLLNRYYFLRSDDTPETVANLVYGDRERATDLEKWNKDTSWDVGNCIYYSSPHDPQHTAMFSYYDENEVDNEAYQVQQGDTLSAIAQTKYQHANVWREIAVVNQLENPDLILPGQMINLKPVVLRSVRVTKLDTHTATTRNIADEAGVNSQVEDGAAFVLPQPNDKTAKQTELERSKNSGLAAVGIWIGQNSWALGIGAISFLLTLWYFLRRHEHEDSILPPTE